MLVKLCSNKVIYHMNYIEQYLSVTAHLFYVFVFTLYVTITVFLMIRLKSHAVENVIQRGHGIVHVCFSWNEWLRLPVKYCDLPRDSMLCLTIWDIYGTGEIIPVGGTTILLFGKYG